MIEAAPKRRAKALALIDWPLADRESWRIALLDGDVLEPGGPASKWALATRSGAGTGYGRWLAWLASRGPLERDKSAVCHVTPANVAMFVAELRQEYATSSAATYLAFLVMALGAMAPNQDWGWLQRSVARLRRRAQPVRDKRRRLQSTDDLLSFGIELMTATDAATSVESAEPTLRWEAATQYRDGLMIALLALRPLRRKNFCAIEIGRHLLQRKQAYWLAFERTETKNNQPLENPFPTELVAWLERYLTCYRPWLCQQTANRDPRYAFKPAGARLWVSKTGSGLSIESFYSSVCQRTKAKFGIALHPHLFRDCAATTIATNDPDHVRITLSILGHSTMATSERYYNHAVGVQSARAVQNNILLLRQSAPRENGHKPHPDGANR